MNSVKMELDGEIFEFDKQLLISKNEFLKDLIINNKFYDYLKEINNISKDGFLLLERFYENEALLIKEENYVDILTICVYFHENGLLNICINLLKSVNDIGLIRLLDRIIIKSLPLNVLIEILKDRKIDDNELIKIYLKYYKRNKNEESKKSINQLLLKINFEKINLNHIKVEDLNDFGEINEKIEEIKKKELSKIDNLDCSKETKDLIIDYYFNKDDIDEIEEKDTYVIMKEENLEKILNKDLNIKIILIISLMILKSKKENVIMNRKEIIYKILYEYNENRNDIKRNIIKKIIPIYIIDGIIYIFNRR